MAKLVQKVGNEWQVQVQEDLVRKRLSLGRGRLAGEQLLVESDTVPGWRNNWASTNGFTLTRRIIMIVSGGRSRLWYLPMLHRSGTRIRTQSCSLYMLPPTLPQSLLPTTETVAVKLTYSKVVVDRRQSPKRVIEDAVSICFSCVLYAMPCGRSLCACRGCL